MNEKLLVGASAENLANRIAERRAYASLQGDLRSCGYKEASANALAAYRANGRDWWENSGSDAVADLEVDVEFALAKLAGDLRMENPPRFLHRSSSRYRTRSWVHSVVARWASWRLQKQVLPRTVRTCREELLAAFPPET